MPTIPALGRQRQENHDFMVSLTQRVRPLGKKTKEREEEGERKRWRRKKTVFVVGLGFYL